MIFNKMRTMVFSLAFMVPQLLHAKVSLHWNEVLEKTIKNNPQLISAELDKESSNYKVKATKSAFYPEIKGGLSANYDSSDFPKNSRAFLSTTENIFSGFSDKFRIKAARLDLDKTTINAEIIKAQVSFDLKSAFAGLLYAEKNIVLTEDIIKRREANLKLVQLRFESGRENAGSLNLSRAYLTESKYDHLRAQNSLGNFQADLSRVMGLEQDTDLSVNGNVPVSAPPYENNQRLEQEKIIPGLLELQSADKDVELSKINLDLSQSAFYPSLDLNQTLDRSKRESFQSINTWSVGVSLTFPLFSGGRDYYSYKSASEDYRSKILNRRDITASALSKIKEAYARYVEAVMKLEVDSAFVLAANTRERIAKAQYNNGLISFTDWDTIENDLINRQKSMLSSERERVIAEAAWEQIQGKGIIP